MAARSDSGKIRGNLVIATNTRRQQTAGIFPERCSMDATRTVACLIYPDVMSLDVTGPMQVFAS
ncbi:MAG TPA: AraC family transcriptional regulator, partial [Pseudomonas sp.]|nr:AraC family transcriptional regulator [Pseudomonas sp.]